MFKDLKGGRGAPAHGSPQVVTDLLPLQLKDSLPLLGRWAGPVASDFVGVSFIKGHKYKEVMDGLCDSGGFTSGLDRFSGNRRVTFCIVGYRRVTGG